jgi:hypothetical protein
MSKFARHPRMHPDVEWRRRVHRHVPSSCTAAHLNMSGPNKTYSCYNSRASIRVNSGVIVAQVGET